MMRGLRIGELDRLITIEQPINTIDEYTHEKKTVWQKLETVYSKRLGGISREAYESNQQVDQSVTRYMVRHRKDINATMRINDDGKLNNITGIENADRGSYLILTTITRDNG